MKLYKVLEKSGDTLISPYKGFEFVPGKKYICEDFDEDKNNECSRGFYATGVDGLIYTFRNLPKFEVWEVRVGGRSVEIDQFKRRYSEIELVKHVPNGEVKRLALAEEKKVGYKLAEALFPVNPLLVERSGGATNTETGLLKNWDAVWGSVGNSVWYSVWGSVRDSVRGSVRGSVGNSVGDSVWCSVWDSVGNSVGASVWDAVGDSVWGSAWDSVWGSVRDSVRGSVGGSVGAYISSLFPNISKWQGVDHEEGVNPFQSCIDLWLAGLVPSFDGKTWRLHAGKNAEIVFESREGTR